jgi:hypothetical protein
MRIAISNLIPNACIDIPSVSSRIPSAIKINEPIRNNQLAKKVRSLFGSWLVIGVDFLGGPKSYRQDRYLDALQK